MSSFNNPDHEFMLPDAESDLEVILDRGEQIEYAEDAFSQENQRVTHNIDWGLVARGLLWALAVIIVFASFVLAFAD